MKQLTWNLDEQAAYWARRIPIGLKSSEPLPQYGGESYRVKPWENVISTEGFPSYCYDSYRHDSVYCSPTNIVRCLQDGRLLEGLLMVVMWGSMMRTKFYVYWRSKDVIDAALNEAVKLIRQNNSVEDAWIHLRSSLGWSPVMTSKYLHFLARSLGHRKNPPVPIDNKVILREVWPRFKREMVEKRQQDDPPVCRRWQGGNPDWPGYLGYNRYMTAVICWAEQRGWTTTELENTMFAEYRPKTDCS